jgi:hypothetical protein
MCWLQHPALHETQLAYFNGWVNTKQSYRQAVYSHQLAGALLVLIWAHITSVTKTPYLGTADSD